MLAFQPLTMCRERTIGMMEKRSAYILNKHPDLLVRCAIPQGYDGVLNRPHWFAIEEERMRGCTNDSEKLRTQASAFSNVSWACSVFRIVRSHREQVYTLHHHIFSHSYGQE
jgi:hypothetical protein